MGILNKIWSEGFEKMILTEAPVKDTLKAMQDSLNQEVSKDLK